MTPMRSVLFWGVVVVVAGLAIRWLIASQQPAGPWLLAAFLAAHGLLHLLFVAPAPAEASTTWAFDASRSWVTVRVGPNPDALRAVGLMLVSLTVAAFAVAALSTVGWLVPTDWWRPAVSVSSVLSMVVLGLYFNPQLVVGLGIDAVLLWVASTGAWSP